MNDLEHDNEDETLAPELLGQQHWSKKAQSIASINTGELLTSK